MRERYTFSTTSSLEFSSNVVLLLYSTTPKRFLLHYP